MFFLFFILKAHIIYNTYNTNIAYNINITYNTNVVYNTNITYEIKTLPTYDTNMTVKLNVWKIFI